MCDPINSFMAYAENYCLDGPILRRDSIASNAPYANLRVDACAAETCVEVNRDVTFSGGQTRTAQAILHQTDVFLNGSSSNVGNLGISRSMLTSRNAREAALARLEAYALTHQLPQTCSVNNPCEALTAEQIETLKTTLQSESIPTSTIIWGALSTMVGGAYAIHLFHAIHSSAVGVPFFTGLSRIVANDVIGLVYTVVHPLQSGSRALGFIRNTWQALGVARAAAPVAVEAVPAAAAAITSSASALFMIPASWLNPHQLTRPLNENSDITFVPDNI